MIAVSILAFGVAAWGHVAHLHPAPLSSHLAHVARDGTLALPLAWLALQVARRLAGATRRPGAAAPLAAAFMSAMLIPASVVHAAIEPAAGATHAMTGSVGSSILPGAHSVADALGAFPAALVAAALAVGFRRRARRDDRRPRRRAHALALACMSVIAMLPVRAGASHVAFSDPLPIPPELTGSDITIRMQAADVQIMPGAKTRMWTYDGIFPGPTIRRPSGQRTKVTFLNDLPPEAGSTTVHHHGGHQASSEDGQPHSYLIEPGGTRTYTYDLMEDGAPERGAFQWYHDHRMDVTGRNVWMGLAGMVILDDPAEASLPLPSGAYDVPLMIADRSFDSGNQIPYTFDLAGVRGDHALVNGAAQPYMTVADRRYRLRLLNASNERSYLLALSNSAPFKQIATESGLLPAPVTRTMLRLGPAERAEIVVDFAGRLGQRLTLRNLVGTGPTLDLMQFRVDVDASSDPSSVPALLRASPSIDWTPPSLVRQWTLGQTTDTWTINGLGFDPARSDTAPVHPRVGSTERWVFTNASTVDHVVHIHDVDWKIVSRRSRFANDPEETAAEQGLKETFLIRPLEVVEVVSRFTDHVGDYVLHCHILEHEDRAMMARFDVVA